MAEIRNLQINSPKNKWLLKEGWEKGRIRGKRLPFGNQRTQGRWSENQFNSWDCD